MTSIFGIPVVIDPDMPATAPIKFGWPKWVSDCEMSRDADRTFRLAVGEFKEVVLEAK